MDPNNTVPQSPEDYPEPVASVLHFLLDPAFRDPDGRRVCWEDLDHEMLRAIAAWCNEEIAVDEASPPSEA